MSVVMIVQPVLLSALAVTMFQTAVLFISGDLAQESLGGLYKAFPSALVRTLVALIFLLGPGNLIVAKAFQNVAVAAPAVMLFQVIAAAVAYCYIRNVWLSSAQMMAVAAMAVLVIGLAISFNGK